MLCLGRWWEYSLDRIRQDLQQDNMCRPSIPSLTSMSLSSVACEPSVAGGFSCIEIMIEGASLEALCPGLLWDSLDRNCEKKSGHICTCAPFCTRFLISLSLRLIWHAYNDCRSQL